MVVLLEGEAVLFLEERNVGKIILARESFPLYPSNFRFP